MGVFAHDRGAPTSCQGPTLSGKERLSIDSDSALEQSSRSEGNRLTYPAVFGRNVRCRGPAVTLFESLADETIIPASFLEKDEESIVVCPIDIHVLAACNSTNSLLLGTNRGHAR